MIGHEASEVLGWCIQDFRSYDNVCSIFHWNLSIFKAGAYTGGTSFWEFQKCCHVLPPPEDAPQTTMVNHTTRANVIYPGELMRQGALDAT